MRFKNGSNKVVIKLRVVQFWSEIILVILNRTRAVRLFDFEVTRTISAQIAHHSVQLPLFTTYLPHPLNLYLFCTMCFTTISSGMTGAGWFKADQVSVASWCPSQVNLRKCVTRPSDSFASDFLDNIPATSFPVNRS